MRSASRRALWIGSAALGLNLLTRVTTGIDVMAAATVDPMANCEGSALNVTVTGYVATPEVVLATLLSFIQEYRSSKAAERLRAMVSTTATVLRMDPRKGVPDEVNRLLRQPGLGDRGGGDGPGEESA